MNQPEGGWIHRAVSQFEGPLLRYATRITGDLERGRDVVQDTFLRLCREQPDQVEGHLAEWLFTVCRNRALDVRRKESRMTIATDKQAAAQASREPGQDTAAQDRDTAAHVLELVSRLPENQQEVVRLKFQNGLSYREISRITELSVSNVGYLLHTALRRLRKEMSVECA